MMQPRSYGGFELGPAAFFRVISEVARGCPSTGWCLCLGAGHSLQIASYWPREAQEQIFSARGRAIVPASRAGTNVSIRRVEGGLMVSGVWRYGSGAPYSTHMAAISPVPTSDDRDHVDCWFIVPREDYEVVDDWGHILGLRGSGSNSLALDGVFVPDEMVALATWTYEHSGETVGSALHQNPTYAGTIRGFAAGGILSVMVGTAYAAVDEYVRFLRSSKVPGTDVPRWEDPNYQRYLGHGLALADSAAAICVRAGQLYASYAEESVRGVHPFTAVRGARLQAMYSQGLELAAEAAEVLLRNGSSTALLDGQRMQRYHRDMTTAISRVTSFDFDVAALGAIVVSADGPLLT